jgi:UDP-glucose 4-epimerase
MRVLVTGATGFVGGHLLPALAERHDVIALARDPSRVTARERVSVVEADLSRPLEAAVLPPFDAVVHLAQANVPFPERANELFRVNVGSTQELLAAAREAGARRFVLASSGSVYGFGDAPVAESDPLRATDFYAVTKRSAELLVGAYRDELETTILRFFAPYGPGQRGRLVPSLVQRVREGRPVTLNEGGRPRMTPIFVDDVVRVVLAALDRDGHEIVNVAGDEVCGIDDLAAAIGEALGREPVFEPGGNGAGDLIASNARMRELLHAAPLVPVAEGLRRTVEAS